MHLTEISNSSDQAGQREVRRLFYVVLLLALIVRIGVAVKLPNLYWADEVFQTQEPAHSLAYGNGMMSWEFRTGARSWVFPGFLAAVMRATDWMGQGSDGYLLGVTIVLCLISLSAVWFSFAWTNCVSGAAAAVVAATAAAFWYELIYYAPKAFSEVLAGNLLLPGLYLGHFADDGPRVRWRLFLASFFIGLACALRMQLAPVMILAAFFFCRKSWRERLVPVISGMLLPILCFGLVDFFTWSHLFQSYVTMLRFQATIGGSWKPWYYFFVRILFHYGPLIPFVCLGARRSPFLAWMLVAIVLPHSFVSHKEWRFIYPAMPLMITLAAIGAAEVFYKLQARILAPQARYAAVAMSVVFFLLASSAMAAAFPWWKQHRGDLMAFRALSHEPGVCGVALYLNPWWSSGGYTYLHRNVPVYLLDRDTELTTEASSFNAVVSSQALPKMHGQFETAQCWNSKSDKPKGFDLVAETVCIYRRPGTCERGSPDLEVNRKLKNKGE